MSGTTPAERFHLPADATGREALAGEFVLGTLDTATSTRVAAAVQGDAAWRVAVQAWERRLGPIALLVGPDQPAPDMWERIEARITPHRVHVARGPRLSWVWRGWAITATILAVGLGVLALLPSLGLAPPPAPRLMASLVAAAERSSPSWFVDVDAKGELRLIPFRGVTGVRAVPPAGRVLQLWALLPGATTPIDLGVLPRVPTIVTIPAQTAQPVAEMVLQISVEPDGGSKIGRPTGPIVFIGRLSDNSLQG